MDTLEGHKLLMIANLDYFFELLPTITFLVLKWEQLENKFMIKEQVKFIIKEPIVNKLLRLWLTFVIYLSLIHLLVKSYDPSENQRNSYRVF